MHSEAPTWQPMKGKVAPHAGSSKGKGGGAKPVLETGSLPGGVEVLLTPERRGKFPGGHKLGGALQAGTSLYRDVGGESVRFPGAGSGRVFLDGA